MSHLGEKLLKYPSIPVYENVKSAILIAVFEDTF